MAGFEHGDDELVAAKGNRSRIEYYFTCTPSIPLYVLRNNPDIDVITYVDADLYFYSSPQPIYDELGDGAVLIVEHRFPTRLEYLVDHGIYNVGLLSFRNDARGLACLNWWRERCIEWCYDRVEGDRFADQKYLDHWPELFDGVVVLQNKGAGLSPWNVDRYAIRSVRGQTLIDSDPLVFYHFHGLKQIAPQLYDSGLESYNARMAPALLEDIYAPHLRELAPLIREHSASLTSIRKKQSYGKRELAVRLVHGRTLFVAGSMVMTVHLKPMLRQILRLLHGLRKFRAKSVRKGRAIRMRLNAGDKI
jgi:hypothetical protein